MTKDDDIKLTMNAFSVVLSEVIEDIEIRNFSSHDFNFNKYKIV